MRIILNIAFVGLLIFPWFAYSSTKSVQDSILIGGEVYHHDNKLRDYEIKIYIGNQLFKTVSSTKKYAFRAFVPVDEICTIELSAANYYDKRFIFDTHVPKEYRKEIPTFIFDMDLFSEVELEGVNTSALDLPVSIIQFRTHNLLFMPLRNYTRKMQKIYKKLKIEAKLQERMQMKN